MEQERKEELRIAIEQNEDKREVIELGAIFEYCLLPSVSHKSEA